MVNHGVSGITVNATLTALKFFFQITLDKPEVVTRVCPVTVARKLPVVLSLEEAKRFMFCTAHPKYKAALAVAYGSGLRVSEVVSLKVSDIDSFERPFLWIENDNNIKSSLVWSVVESIPVHEDIKLGRENNQRYVNAWIASMENLAKCGIKKICYNFMPVIDWTRTDSKFQWPNGGYALRFGQQKFAVLIFYIIF